MNKNEFYKSCSLCPRACGVNRTSGQKGACGMSAALLVSRAALHMWEEPPISGKQGSGTVFFAGCPLSCVFCQNAEISHMGHGKEISISRLAEIFLELQEKGAHNINLVTPTHYVPTIREAIITARRQGLAVPIVYNTGSYDTPETLRTLNGLVDIYLPDFKYYRPETAGLYSHAAEYPTVAREAIAEMVRQTGRAELDVDGLMTRGTVVRILLLPGHVAEAKLILHYLYTTYGDAIYVSLMNQYTPMPKMPPPLDRRVTRQEYDQLTDYALRLGVTNCFIQDGGTAEESFIPPFDNNGVLPRNK